MERLTERVRNHDGTGAGRQLLINRTDGCPGTFCFQILTKLADYEDLDEQGRLLKLPCRVGDTVYEISYVGEPLEERRISGMEISRGGFSIHAVDAGGNHITYAVEDFDGTVFTEREAAERVLREENCINPWGGENV